MIRWVESTSRFAVKASQRINRKRTTAVREISEPIEDTVFHSVYASG